MLTNASLTAFLATSDPARSKAFYGDLLGLRLVADDEFALVFDANGTSLRVQKVQAHQPHPFTALGWQVPDVCDTVMRLSGRGVSCERYALLAQDELGVWVSPSGTKVAWFRDPDGNLLSLSE